VPSAQLGRGLASREPRHFMTTLDILPVRQGGAAENMAADFMGLQRYPAEKNLRFRHYGWHRPAFTFGYSQKIAYVRLQLPPSEHPELCRRPTGGGVVDHRDDWTYMLVIPRGHAAYDARAVESYRIVHQCLVDALTAQQQDAVLKDRCDECAEGEGAAAGPSVCFVKPELYDVIRSRDGRKIAGAAQKRNKHGLLFQGSVARAAVGPEVDWDTFQQAFIERMASALQVEAHGTGWPDWPEHEFDGLVEQYSSTEWNEFR
jgi:lipoate-protein ligase A